jgi:hypothetical protein
MVVVGSESGGENVSPTVYWHHVTNIHRLPPLSPRTCDCYRCLILPPLWLQHQIRCPVFVLLPKREKCSKFKRNMVNHTFFGALCGVRGNHHNSVREYPREFLFVWVEGGGCIFFSLLRPFQEFFAEYCVCSFIKSRIFLLMQHSVLALIAFDKVKLVSPSSHIFATFHLKNYSNPSRISFSLLFFNTGSFYSITTAFTGANAQRKLMQNPMRKLQ